MKTTDSLSPSVFLPTIPVGTALTFELKYKDNHKAFGGTSRLIGYRDKKYMLLETPADPELGKLLLEPADWEVVIRGLSSSRYGEIFALRSHILSVMHRPEKMLAIAIPSSVSIHRMRRFARYTVSRIVKLAINGRNTLAKLADFSLGGCAIRVSNSQFVDKGESVRFSISNLLDETVYFNGTVASVSSSGEGIQLGITFNDERTHQSRDVLARLILSTELDATNSTSDISTVA
ncbi:flagellar brake protein [Enterovibrio makurazakiensis]|uniref:PilZ domain-containing protein n=1 Tax=Enterovibrio makurazakiensis TaxID=2910232 RepID=UPI003D24E402